MKNRLLSTLLFALIFISSLAEATIKMATPGITSVAQSGKQINLQFSLNNAVVDKIYVYRSTSATTLGTRFLVLAGSATGASDTYSSFKLGVTYYYRIKVYRSGYTLSDASSVKSIVYGAAASPTPTPTPTPVPITLATPGPVLNVTSSTYTRGVISIIYNPMDSSDQLIDPHAHTDVINALNSWADAEGKTTNGLINELVSRQQTTALGAVQKASKFRYSQNVNAAPSVTLENLATYQQGTAIPYVNDVLPDPNQYLIDMNTILNQKNICDWVDNRNVREVWIYKTRSVTNYFHPEFYISSPQFNHALEMGWKRSAAPVCSKTYTIVVHDTERWDLFMHVWYHSFEALMRKIDNPMWSLWQGPCDSNYSCYPLASGTQTLIGRCGNAHNAPNARSEYDITNTASALSDCEDFNPDGPGGYGTLAPISCQKWGCTGSGTIESNETVNYTVWNLQNMPGLDNTITAGGKQFRNWWEAYIEFDKFKTTGLNFYK